MKKRETNRMEEVRPELDRRAYHLMRAEARDREYVVSNSMSAIDPLYIDPKLVPEGWVWKWLARTVLGIPDYERENAKFSDGWAPVRASDFPELLGNRISDPEINNHGNVVMRKGLLLCEITAKKYKQMEDATAKVHASAIKSLGNAVERMPNDPTIPSGILENSDDVSVNYGRTFGN